MGKETTARAGAKSAEPARRGIGRPQLSEPKVGREALLEKTCELLRIMPPAQVTRAEVARFAGVDPGLIRYYFKDTSTLLVAAAESLCAKFGADMAKVGSLAGLGVEERVRARISALLALEIQQPNFNRLMIETVVGSPTPAAQKLMKDVNARGVGAYKALLDEGLASGEFREVDSAYLHFSIIALCEFFVAGLPILGVATGKKPDLKTMGESYRQFICDLVINGLRPLPAARPAPRRAPRPRAEAKAVAIPAAVAATDVKPVKPARPVKTARPAKTAA